MSLEFCNFNTKGQIRYARKTKRHARENRPWNEVGMILFFKLLNGFLCWFLSRLWNIYFRKYTAIIRWPPRKRCPLCKLREHRFSAPEFISSSSRKHVFLQRVQKVPYVGFNWLISIHVVYFVSWKLWLATCYLSGIVLLFSCNLIGQLWLGSPGYSSRTVI